MNNFEILSFLCSRADFAKVIPKELIFYSSLNYVYYMRKRKGEFVLHNKLYLLFSTGLCFLSKDTLHHTYPLFLPFSDIVSFSFSTEISLETDGSFFSSSCSLRLADFLSISNSESGSTTTTSSSGMVSVRVRGVVPAGILKVSWNWMGMLILRNIISVLAF